MTKAKDYLEKKKGGHSYREKAELLERKNWHLCQLLGAILYASEDPEQGFTFAERDALEVEPKDLEFIRDTTEKGTPTVTIRIRSHSAQPS